MAGWMKEALGAYQGNPVALRDFRVQFRNGRVVGLLLIYTVILTLISYTSYSTAQSFSGQSISYVQSTLNSTYSAIVGALYVMVAAIAALSSSFSVIAERQRKALDLVFSAPFSPRRYVIGKMVSGLRYSGILVVLALPALATMVAAGGATVEDVLLHAVFLAANAMAWSAVGIAFASCSRNFILPLSATVLTALVWCIIAAAIGAMSAYGPYSSSPSSSALHPDWLASLQLCSLGIGAVSPTETVSLFGFLLPAWIPAIVVLLLLTRFAVTAAIAGLEYPVIKAGFWLRVSGVLYTLGLSTLTAFCLPEKMSGFSNERGTAVVLSVVFLLWLFSLLFTAPFGPDREQKVPDRTGLNLKEVFRPHSSSALAYSMVIVAAWWLPLAAVRDYLRESHAVLLIAHSFCFFAFWTAVLRLYSMAFKSAATARVSAVATLALLSVGAVTISAIWFSAGTTEISSFGLIDFSIVRPWLGSNEQEAAGSWLHILALGVLALLIFSVVEVSRAKRAS